MHKLYLFFAAAVLFGGCLAFASAIACFVGIIPRDAAATSAWIGITILGSSGLATTACAMIDSLRTPGR